MLLLIAMVGMAGAYAYHRDFYGLYEKWRARDAELETMRDQAREAQMQEQRLSDKAEDLNKDVVEMEAAIRRNKTLVREGETVYRVELPPQTTPMSENGESEESLSE